MSARDPYKIMGRIYDRLIEPAEKKVRPICLEVYPPKPGQRVVDMGCGTGTHLAIYKAAGCEIAGVDLSPTMLGEAQRKLGAGADLRLENATKTSFADQQFDLANVMFALHEMPQEVRPLVLQECKRLVKPDGLVMVTDYFRGPCPFPMGQVWRGIILSMEIMAGREHFANFRHFLTHGGLPPLLEAQQLITVDRRISRRGEVAVYLLRKLPAGR